jgi:aspartate aminotransferase
LQYAKLAIVPFYAFGAPNASPWYRLSVGTCKREELDVMLEQLGDALESLH